MGFHLNGATCVPVTLVLGQSNAKSDNGLDPQYYPQPTLSSQGYIWNYNYELSTPLAQNDLIEFAFGATSSANTGAGQNDRHHYDPVTLATARESFYRNGESYIFKLTAGGTAKAFDDGNPNRDSWNPALTGEIFDKFKEQWTLFNADLRAQGKAPYIHRINWIQGESDRGSTVAEYETALNDCINAINDFVCQNPKWLIWKLTPFVDSNGSIIQAQENVAASNPRVSLFNTDKPYTVFDDLVHYDNDTIYQFSLDYEQGLFT